MKESSEQKTPTVPGAVFTLIIPLDRDKSKTATFHIKELDEETFMAAKSLYDRDKDFDAVILMLKALSLPPSDSPDLLKGNLIALRAGVRLFQEILMPVSGELKKN